MKIFMIVLENKLIRVPNMNLINAKILSLFIENAIINQFL